MPLFETLKHMADNNMDISRFDTLHSADLYNKGKNGKITMLTSPDSIKQLGGIVGKQTHIPILFMIDAEQYEKVDKLLKQPQSTEVPNHSPVPVIRYSIMINKGDKPGLIEVEFCLDDIEIESLSSLLIDKGYIKTWCNNDEFTVISRSLIK